MKEIQGNSAREKFTNYTRVSEGHEIIQTRTFDINTRKVTTHYELANEGGVIQEFENIEALNETLSDKGLKIESTLAYTAPFSRWSPQMKAFNEKHGFAE